MRILVVEDEKKLAQFIACALREDGQAVDVSLDGEEAGRLLASEDYDAVVLDLQLPGRNGIEVLKDLRKRKKPTPVLILTVRNTVKDRVRGLDAGADDYLVKPFSLDELRARVRALLRRGQGSAASVLEYADLSMNLAGRTVSRGHRKITLTHKQFALLEFFLRNPGCVLTRTSIAEHVWEVSFEWHSNVVDVFVGALREKLEEAGEPRLIHTVRGSGYVLREEPGGVR